MAQFYEHFTLTIRRRISEERREREVEEPAKREREETKNGEGGRAMGEPEGEIEESKRGGKKWGRGLRLLL